MQSIAVHEVLQCLVVCIFIFLSGLGVWRFRLLLFNLLGFGSGMAIREVSSAVHFEQISSVSPMATAKASDGDVGTLSR